MRPATHARTLLLRPSELTTVRQLILAPFRALTGARDLLKHSGERYGRYGWLAASAQARLTQLDLLWTAPAAATGAISSTATESRTKLLTPQRVAGGLAALAGLAAAMGAAVFHAESATSLATSLAMLHQFVASGAQAGLLFLCLSLTALVGAQVLVIANLFAKAGTGLAALGALAFAQVADPDDGGSRYGKVDAPLPAASEIQGALYLGGSVARNSDVILKAPDDTDAIFRNVKWANESLVDSPFYGVRGIKWAQTATSLGSMIDYTHTKATAYEQKVEQSGKVKGKELTSPGKFEDSFRKLEFTHGLNQLTMNGLFRLTGLHPRIRPYFGIGLGLMIPHVDAQRAGFPRKTRTLGPQITGPVFQVLGGVEWRIFVSNRYSAITEYKMAHSRNTAKIKTGGTVSTNFWINQIVIGITRTFWRAAPAAN